MRENEISLRKVSGGTAHFTFWRFYFVELAMPIWAKLIFLF